jgi:hypothetical protein
LLHFRKIGGDEAQTLDTLVTERGSNDDHPRAVRDKLAGKPAANAVRATDNGNLFAPAILSPGSCSK